MNEHLSSASLKSLAKGQMLGKYGTLIGAYAIHLSCILFAELWAGLLVDNTTPLGMLISYAVSFIISLIGGLFLYGESYIYLKIACNQKATIHDIFHGFSGPSDKIIKIQVILALAALIASLPNLLSLAVMENPENPYLMLLYVIILLIVMTAYVIFNMTFSQCYYLMLDFPHYTPKQILIASRKVMKGNRGRLFYIELSFLPLYLLGICSCFVSFLWILPYMQAVKANFYLDLMKKKPTDF